MDAYDRIMKPVEKKGLAEVRAIQVSKAYGRVLELGAGNAANLPYYNFAKVSSLTISDIKFSKKLEALSTYNGNPKVSFSQCSAAAIPFDSESFDTVLFTLVFCSVEDVSEALAEVRRVLKKDGQVIFIEHVIAPGGAAKSIMNAVNTPWKKLARGCNLNRDFRKALLESGFIINEEEQFFKELGYYGVARVGV